MAIRTHRRAKAMPPPTTADSSPMTAADSARLLSLDAFRGLVIVMMFLVNVAGTDRAFPSWFPHRGWNNGQMGNGLADYVFPWFLFIVGVAIPFSMNSGRGRAMSTGAKVLAALRRGTIIYLFGTLLWCATIGYKPPIVDPAAPPRWHGPIDWHVILHWDILPLIGWGYFLGVCLYLMPRSVWVRLGFVVIVLLAKFAILRLIPYPGETQVVWEQTRSVQSWINGRLGWMGVALTQGLPATACVTLGSLAGDWLRRVDLSPSRRAAWLAAVGLTTYLAALALHLSGLMPSSKDFFTSTYVLCTGGAAALTLAVMYWLVDIRRVSTLWVLRIYGMNALAAYLGAELIWKTAMMQWHVKNPANIGGSSVMITAIKAHLQSLAGNTVGSWLVVAGYIAFYWTICWLLARRKVFIKV